MTPKEIIIRILYVLLAIAFVVLGYLITEYVLAMLGIRADQIVKVIFVIIGLLVAIWALTGRLDPWVNPR